MQFSLAYVRYLQFVPLTWCTNYAYILRTYSLIGIHSDIGGMYTNNLCKLSSWKAVESVFVMEGVRGALESREFAEGGRS